MSSGLFVYIQSSTHIIVCIQLQPFLHRSHLSCLCKLQTSCYSNLNQLKIMRVIHQISLPERLRNVIGSRRYYKILYVFAKRSRRPDSKLSREICKVVIKKTKSNDRANIMLLHLAVQHSLNNHQCAKMCVYVKEHACVPHVRLGVQILNRRQMQ